MHNRTKQQASIHTFWHLRTRTCYLLTKYPSFRSCLWRSDRRDRRRQISTCVYRILFSCYLHVRVHIQYVRPQRDLSLSLSLPGEERCATHFWVIPPATVCANTHSLLLFRVRVQNQPSNHIQPIRALPTLLSTLLAQPTIRAQIRLTNPQNVVGEEGMPNRAERPPPPPPPHTTLHLRYSVVDRSV